MDAGVDNRSRPTAAAAHHSRRGSGGRGQGNSGREGACRAARKGGGPELLRGGPGRLLELATAQTGDGQPLAVPFRTRLAHEWVHLETLEARLADLTATRDASLATGTDRVATVARHLCTIRGVAETSAAVFSAEVFGTRAFTNGRELGALLRLVPVPYRSDQAVRDQGISTAGRAERRRMCLQIAWGWLRWQPDSALTQWFQRRFGAAGARSRHIGIVAVARTLAIARWRDVEHGIIPEGARLKA